MRTRVLSPPVRTLDVFVEVLSQVDAEASSDGFYNSFCEALCRLTTMRRAVLFLYDRVLARVAAVGCHGIDPALLLDVHGTLEETPMAQRALAEDAVQEISPEELERQLPARFKGANKLLEVSTLTCTPLHAGSRSFGVIFADRGGGPFTLTEDERHAMWMLGKLVALAVSARSATRQQERARHLSERIELTRQVHERVMHRLFGVSLALSSSLELDAEDRERCSSEIRDALSDLRSALARMPGSRRRRGGSTLREELGRLARGYAEIPVSCDWRADERVPEPVDSLAQAVLKEALRNAVRHAAPTLIEVHVSGAAETFSLEVLNDGLGRASAGTGIGLKLASLEALQLGGVVEFGPSAGGRWRTRLVVPL